MSSKISMLEFVGQFILSWFSLADDEDGEDWREAVWMEGLILDGKACVIVWGCKEDEDNRLFEGDTKQLLESICTSSKLEVVEVSSHE